MVCRPIVTSSIEKKERSEIASTMSGMIIGAKISASRLRLFLRRVSMPIASSVPRSVAIRVETSATISVFSAAERISWFEASETYHLVEKPDQTVGRPPSLKESATSTPIGT